MFRPQCYEPAEGYKFQIVYRNRSYGPAFEHLDYAKDREELRYLLTEYRMAYHGGGEFRAIILPRKYWPKPTTPAPIAANVTTASTEAARNEV